VCQRRNAPEIEKKEPGWTFFMMGSTASVLLDEDEAAARPFGMCESGTRMGLCRRMDRFFCDLPMAETLWSIPYAEYIGRAVDSFGSSLLLVKFLFNLIIDEVSKT